MNVVIYARYSSTNQTEQSIEGQIDVCTRYAAEHGYTVSEHYIDRALSATTDHRPAFQRMIHDSARHQFSAVIVYQLDRFSRDRYDSAVYKSKLKKNEVRVISAREQIAEDASGILMESLLEGMAEYFSKELSQKVTRGRGISIQKGGFVGGTVTYGYKVKNRQYFINEDEASVVRNVFTAYISGKGLSDIVRYLRYHNIHNRNGYPFQITTVKYMLQNKRYIGTLSHLGTEYENVIPSIVTSDEFEIAAHLMNTTTRPVKRPDTGDSYLLSHYTYCGSCLGAVTGVSGTSHTSRLYRYYCCSTQRHSDRCQQKNAPKDVCELAVINALEAVVSRYQLDSAIAKAEEFAMLGQSRYMGVDLKKALATNKQAIKNLIKAVEMDGYDETIAGQLLFRREERTRIEEEIAKRADMTPHIVRRNIRKYFESQNSANANDIEKYRLLIHTFVHHILFYSDHLEICCILTENPLIV